MLHIALNAQAKFDGQDRASELLRWLLQDRDGASDIVGLGLTWQGHAAAMQQLQQQVNQPDVLRQLLWTAVLRGHFTATALLCRMPASLQLSVDDASDMITSALRSTDGVLDLDYIIAPDQLLEAVCQHLPAAKQLPVSYVADKIHKVIEYSHRPRGLAGDMFSQPLLEALCRLPAAKQLPVPCLVDLINKLIDGSRDSSRQTLQAACRRGCWQFCTSIFLQHNSYLCLA
jgi:hypothetical protein